MFKLDPFWYTFHDPFLTTLVIALAIIIPCYLVYLCIILLIIKYKKRKRIQRAGYNAVNIKCNKVINEVKNDGNNGNNENFDMNDDMNDEAKVQEDLVVSTFFLKDLSTLEEIASSSSSSSF